MGECMLSLMALALWGCEAVFDLIVEFFGCAVAVAGFAALYVAWEVCALALRVGGTVFYGLAVLVRWDDEAASRDGADALRNIAMNSAVMSLRRNMSHKAQDWDFVSKDEEKRGFEARD